LQAKFFVGGNWKCNGTHASVEDLVCGLNAGRVPSDIDVVVAPPFIFLDWVRAHINDQYHVAAQNCWVKSDGAFTGEISAEMLKDAQVPWVITGHSERRSLCGESNTFVGQKTGHALDVGLKVRAQRMHGYWARPLKQPWYDRTQTTLVWQQCLLSSSGLPLPGRDIIVRCMHDST
jgi:hypothetical protein